jgi:phage baseplate assembly protein W
MRRLIDPKYMTFPFRVDKDGAHVSGRKKHIRQQIEQVLFTNPGERVFRPHFGGGVRQLVFEPNTSRLSDIVKQRLAASLTDALYGEVDPRSLDVTVTAENEKLYISISYRLATLGITESYDVPITSEGS